MGTRRERTRCSGPTPPADSERLTTATGALDEAITVFGSDGGSLVGAVYEVDASGLTRISPDFWGFLEYLRDELSKAAALL